VSWRTAHPLLAKIESWVIWSIICAFVVALLFRFCADKGEEAKLRAIVAEVRPLSKQCPAKEIMELPFTDTALIWDVRSDEPMDANSRLPKSWRASSSDESITVFMVTACREEAAGFYFRAGRAVRQHLTVCVVRWPEKKAIGSFTVVVEPPPSIEVPEGGRYVVEGGSAISGDSDEAMAKFVLASRYGKAPVQTDSSMPPLQDEGSAGSAGEAPIEADKAFPDELLGTWETADGRRMIIQKNTTTHVLPRSTFSEQVGRVEHIDGGYRVVIVENGKEYPQTWEVTEDQFSVIHPHNVASLLGSPYKRANTPDPGPEPEPSPAPKADDASPPPVYRTWSSRDGKFTVEAEFVRRFGTEVTLRKKDGSEIAVPLLQLSVRDREWIRDKISVKPR